MRAAVVEGDTRIGGLVGENGGSVRNSYATADIVCTGVPACATYTVATGGLIGSNAGGIVVNSYWDTATSNIQGSAAGTGKTTLQLQSGNSQSSDASEAYYRWSDSDWHFGNVSQYPILKYTSTTESMLTGLQSYGLESLTIAEVVTLSPHFDTTKLYYRVGVELDANIPHLHLTPSALNAEAIIRIVSDNGFDETVASGISSSAIMLHSTDTTVISVEVSGKRLVRYRFEVDYFSSNLGRDADADGDGLIEILTLEDLDAMRNALDGSIIRQQNDEGVFVENARGCPMTGCRGYELLQDLDFDNPAHYRTGRVNTAWTSGAGWQPIGTQMLPFVATFKGNGYTISNLRVNRPESNGGLFGVIDGSEADVAIEGLGLSDVDIVGGVHVGGLVGHNRAGDISQSYVTGSVSTTGKDGSAIVGGLVGSNVGGSITESYAETQVKGNLADSLTTSLAGGLVALNDDHGRIENSYAIGSVISRGSVGGLVALNRSSSEIINSYAVSRAIAMGATSMAGGLVAVNNATVDDSYWDMEASGVASSAGGISTTTEILQSSTPTSPINSIYRNWNTNVWEFADANRYPTLNAVNNAQLLAPEGKSLLQSFMLQSFAQSSHARLFPSFHPLIFDYELIAESGQMTEVRLFMTPAREGTTIDVACSDGLVCSSGIPISFVLDGSNAPQITINTRTPDADELLYNFSVRYVESEVRRVTETTTTTVSMSLTVAEGERIRLTTPYDFGLNQDSYRYNWYQLIGDPLRLKDALSPVDTQSLVLDFTVPIDVVSKQSDSRTVQLVMEVIVNGNFYATQFISLIISKRDNDSGNRARLLKDNNKIHTYTVRFEREDGSEFVDRDKGLASIDLQWQRRRSDAEDWVNVGSGFPYTLPNEGNYQYRALATYEDNQGYREQFETGVIDYLDIDEDGDGLIEIAYLEELDAIRHQLDGSGYKVTASANKVTAGCPVVNNVEKCRGYELINDLDFTNDASYRTSDTAALSVLKNRWTVTNFQDENDSGWQPIDEEFNAVFNGNGHTISNMQINRSVGTKGNIGLFSRIGATGRIENLGLVDPAIKGLVGVKSVGGIAGAIRRGSVIMNSYVAGDVASGNTDKVIRGDVSGAGLIGGLVGWNQGFILNSYAKINVVAEDSGMASNKRVGVGGLAGRNIDGGKVYNSYATGEVKGPCIVGGLVGNQFSTNSEDDEKRSEIRNSYATGNVETGFGTCSNSNNRIAGGLVGANNDSRVENSYARGEVSGDGTLAGLIGRRLGGSTANPINSYWSFDANCSYETGNPSGIYCYSRRVTTNPLNARLEAKLRSATMPDVTDLSCVDTGNRSYSCQTYTNWKTADWDYGTSEQYPALKYVVGLNTSDPGCDQDPETALPRCETLLPGQFPDTVLLNSLSLSANSREVRLTPSFDPNIFNYKATITTEIVPVAMKIATDADEGTEITIRKDGGTPLTKQSDGSVQISANNSFNVGIETARGNNRKANYEIQLNLRHTPPEPEPLQVPDISVVINGAAPTVISKQRILLLDEGDVVRFDNLAALIGRGLILRWDQLSGKLLFEALPFTDFTVPVDFVARDENDSMVVLELEFTDINNSESAASREILISVRKINNGNSETAVKWISSETLSAGDLSNDIDGGVGDIGYQWSVEQNGVFVEIPGADQKNYTPPENARNVQYRLSISYTDGQGYRTSLSYDAPLYTAIADSLDKDNDGLIEIETLEDLNAIRYQMDGSGYRASSTASKITAGCPDDQCSGYELVRDLDFLDDASYSSTLNKVVWTTGSGWQPIGTITNNICSDSASNCFNTTFEGNGYSISNLRINRDTFNEVGLFAGSTGIIRNLGLSEIEVTGNSMVGGLVGRNEGQLINVYVIGGKVIGQNNIIGLLAGESASGSSIINSYAYGAVTGARWVGGICGVNDGGISKSYAVADVSAQADAGGLVGESQDSISNSYAAGSVSISERERSVGGLVGVLWVGGSVKNSYSTAEVKVAFEIQSNDDVQYVGGLIGRRHSSQAVTNSYWDTDISGQMNSPGGGIAKTKTELQMPTAPGTMENDVYYTWDTNRWDFGTFEEYPVLRYHDNTCSTSTPFPDCGELLLYQRIGLRDLRLEQNMGARHLHLSPNFDPAIMAYTVSAVHADASELKIIPIAANPDAIIVADGKVLPADNSSYTFALNTSGATSTTISVAASNSIATEKPVIYKLTVNNRLPRISINAPASITEGEVLAFNAIVEDLEGDEFSYSLTTIPDLLPNLGVSTSTVVGRADLRYQLNIPSDLLDEMQSMGAVDIVMTADDGSGVVSETMPLTIVKENNGVISLPEPTLNDFTYTIEDIDLSSDSDGINPVPEIAYQWQKELLGSWVDIDDATDASYTVEGIIGDRYRVLVDYTDKQGYRHQGIVSPAVMAPQQFIYNVVRSRDVVRDLMDQPLTISIQVRVLLEGLLR